MESHCYHEYLNRQYRHCQILLYRILEYPDSVLFLYCIFRLGEFHSLKQEYYQKENVHQKKETSQYLLCLNVHTRDYYQILKLQLYF